LGGDADGTSGDVTADLAVRLCQGDAVALLGRKAQQLLATSWSNAHLRGDLAASAGSGLTVAALAADAAVGETATFARFAGDARAPSMLLATVIVAVVLTTDAADKSTALPARLRAAARGMLTWCAALRNYM
jgi:hypothetical protein